MPNTFVQKDIPVDALFIEKFAQMYIEQRNKCVTAIKDISSHTLTRAIGFDTARLEAIIKKNVVAADLAREAGLTPAILNDIYRSDLGELLMTSYFEEELADGEKFIIPEKNISYRELSSLPGRGIDTIGYRISGAHVDILLGEAKVSESKDSPPQVVHQTVDSIYKTQLSRRKNKQAIIERLSDYYRRLSGTHAIYLGAAIVHMEQDSDSLYSITFGGTLVRDHSCVKTPSDYGKMKTDEASFLRHAVHFCVLSFSDRTIQETVTAFYEKVKELAA
jgi:hypothetical protein